MRDRAIDHDKVRVFVHKLDGEDLLVLLGRAIDLLPASDLPKLIKDYALPEDLAEDGSSPTGLLEAVRAFHAASLDGEYYQDFMVNSKNYRDKSRGTQRWIAECHRLLDRFVQAVDVEDTTRTRAAFELMFDLLVRIDDGRIDIIFFADEAGSWQVGVNWDFA